MSHINSIQYLGRSVMYQAKPNDCFIHGMNLLCLRADRETIDPAYATFYFQSQMFKRQIDKIAKKSVNQASFSTTSLKNIKIPAVSLARQREIAARLSAVSALVDACNNLLSALDDLVKSRFVEMFGDKERWASEGWPIAAVSDLICKPKSGEWGEEDLYGKGIKVLRTANFTDAGVINYTNVVTRDIDCSKLKSKGLCTGDILIEKSGGSDKKPVGRVVLFLNQNDTYLNNNFTAALRVKDPSIISYRYLFQSLYMNYWRGGTRPFESKTTGLHNLKLDGYLSKTRIPIPSIEIQQQFADFVARVDKLGFDCCRMTTYCDTVFSSVSARLLCT